MPCQFQSSTSFNNWLFVKNFIVRGFIQNFLIVLIAFSCTPQGPQTFESPFIGKTKEYLISKKGVANKIQVYENSEAHIYVKKEAYYGKSVKPPLPEKPKSIFHIEYIYYINKDDVIYKYQVWRKKIKQ